jgi:hypothetical protein
MPRRPVYMLATFKAMKKAHLGLAPTTHAVSLHIYTWEDVEDMAKEAQDKEKEIDLKRGRQQ